MVNDTYSDRLFNVHWLYQIDLIDNDIAHALMNRGGETSNDILHALVHNMRKCKGLDDQVAQYLIGDGWQETVIKHLDSFGDLNQDTFFGLWSIVDAVFEYAAHHDFPRPSSGDRDNILHHINKFKGLDGKALRVIFETESSTQYITFEYISNIDRFEGVTHDELVELLTAHGAWKHLAHCINDLTVSDKAGLLRQFIDKNHQDIIIENIDKWNDVVSVESATQLYNNAFQKFQDNDHILEEVTDEQEFYDDDYGQDVEHEDFDRHALPESKLHPSDVQSLLYQAHRINEAYGDKLDPVLSRVMKDYDEWPGMVVYSEFKDLMAGKVSDHLSDLGVTHVGEAGFNQLAERLREVRGKIIREQYDPQSILTNPFVTAEAMSLVRYRGNEFGKGGVNTFRDQLFSHIDKKQSLTGLAQEYVPSSVLNIAKVDKERAAEFKHTEDFLSRYGQILDQLTQAQNTLLSQGSHGLNDLRSRIAVHVGEYIKTLRATMQQSPPAFNKRGEPLKPLTPEQLVQRSKHIEQTIERLQSVLDRKPSLQEQFNILRSVKGEFDDDLSQLMFFLGFRYNRDYAQSQDVTSFSRDNPTLDDITWVMNFVDHIVGQETLAKYFTDKKVAKAFRDLIDLSSLEQGLARIQNAAGTKGSMQIRCLPDRGLLTEFSGQIADACWATTRDATILEQFPNITTLLFVQNPDTVHERLAGAALLIKTMSAQDEPLLVIRGLNPIQNVINQLDVKDFYQHTIKYLETIAQRQGRKLSIVIDDHSGGSATNRPVLFSYLEQLKPVLQKVRLKSAKDTTFNGYDIVNNCYLV